MMNLENNWPEYLALLFIIIGFIFALTAIRSLFLLYMTVMLWGLVFGRLIYRCRNKYIFRWVLTVIGFIIGFLAASRIMGYSSRLVSLMIIIVYIGGLCISYYVHKSRFIRSTSY